MSREYAFVASGLSAITTVPIFQLLTPTTTSIEILSLNLNNSSSEESFQEIFTIRRRSTNSTFPAGNAVSPVALNQRDPATLLIAGTLQAAAGLATAAGSEGNILCSWGFNDLTGLTYLPVPEERITVEPSAYITGQFMVNTPSAVNWAITLNYRELN